LKRNDEIEEDNRSKPPFPGTQKRIRIKIDSKRKKNSLLTLFHSKEKDGQSDRREEYEGKERIKGSLKKKEN
jgi:hypothetical protein